MIIGLTGGIGSGKSAAGIEFEKLGIAVIDADEIAQKASLKNSKAYKEIVEYFGASILDNSQNIDRRKLRNIVFNDDEQKKKLEQILHPAIREDISFAISNSKSPYTIIMVPLIYETNSKDNYNRILVIDCDEDIQISRAVTRDGASEEDIKKIINSQATKQERLSIADDVISNNSSIEKLSEKVLHLHKNYLELING
ncbi:MAG: dephospho-CoA kinase [Gammaproteobacteria bacterium]